MARKKNKQNLEMTVQNDAVNFEQDTMYESDAYLAPQQDAGQDVTVLKTVGAGGPIPIIAPKHSTVQLQPIVVPLAVIPYMSNDTSALLYGNPASTSQPGADDRAAEFELEAKKLKKQRKAQPRIFALVNFLLYAVALLPFILSIFMDDFKGISLNGYNVIAIVQDWINGNFAWQLGTIGNVAIAAVLAVGAVISLLTIVFGKYPKVLNILLTILAVAAHVVFLVTWILNNEFVINDSIAFFVSGGASVVNLVLVVVFSILTNKLEDKAETVQASARVI